MVSRSGPRGSILPESPQTMKRPVLAEVVGGVGVDVLEAVGVALGPVDLDRLGPAGGAQAEVEARVGRGEVAAAAGAPDGLPAAANGDDDACAHGIAGRPC